MGVPSLLPKWARVGAELQRLVPYGAVWRQKASHVKVKWIDDDLIHLVVYETETHVLGGMTLWWHTRGKEWHDTDWAELPPKTRKTAWECLLEATPPV